MARSFNGSTDQINCGTSTTLQPPAFTQSIWLNPGTLLNVYNGVIGWASATAGCHAFIKSTGAMAVYCQSGAIKYDPGSHTLSSGTWYHFAFSYDSVNGIVGYVNGSSDGTAAASGTATQAGSFAMGYDPGNAGRNFPGRLADGAVWNAVLTTGEINALAAGARSNTIRRASLVGYWPLDGLSSPEPDLSGNVFNGTLTGTALAAGPPTTLFTPKPPIFSPFTTTTAAQIYAFDQMAARFSRNITTIGY